MGSIRAYIYFASRGKGFPDRLDMGMRERGVTDDFKGFHQSNWKNEVAIN